MIKKELLTQLLFEVPIWLVAQGWQNRERPTLCEFRLPGVDQLRNNDDHDTLVFLFVQLLLQFFFCALFFATLIVDTHQ